MFADQLPSLDPLRPPSAAARGIVLLVALFLILGLAWSTVATLDISATGVGRIVPARDLQVVQNLEGGIVEQTLVKEGDHVKAGQVVARIQNVEFSASFGEAKIQQASLQAEAARLQAEVEGRDLIYSTEFAKKHPELVARERKLLTSRRSELESTVRSDAAVAARARNEVYKVREGLPLMRQQLALAREQRSIVAPQVTRGLISRVELLGVEQRILEYEGKISEMQRAVPGGLSAATEAESRVAATRARFRSESLRRLGEINVKLNALHEALKAHQDRVARREVRSPVNGIIKKLYVKSSGEVLRPAASLLEVVPTDDELIVEAKFSPKDIAFIYSGLPAFIRVTAYDPSIYGALPAEVLNVSADTTINEREEVFYIVRVKAKSGFANQAQPLPLIPGMVAQVDVVTAKRTVFDYLFKPLTKLRYTSLHER